MKKEVIRNLRELDIYTKFFLEQLGQKENSHACVVLLFGDLGVGKTAFVKSCAHHLGVNEEITSPTFVIQKEYPLSHNFFKKLIHIDAYRLEHKDELEYLGWKELVHDSKNVIFIEWPSQVPGVYLPQEYYKISLTIVDQETRELVEQKESL